MSIMNTLRRTAVRTNLVDILYGRGTKRALERISTFSSREGGVVTIEWVAVAAALTIGAISIAFIIMNGLVSPARNIASQLSP